MHPCFIEAGALRLAAAWVVRMRARLSRHPQERADLAELAGQLLPGRAPVPAAVDVAAHAAPQPEPWVGGVRRQVPDRAVGRDREPHARPRLPAIAGAGEA